MICLTKHVFKANAKFAGDNPALHGTVLYTVHHLHPLVDTFLKIKFFWSRAGDTQKTQMLVGVILPKLPLREGGRPSKRTVTLRETVIGESETR